MRAILHGLTKVLYDYAIKDLAVINQVLITEIDGHPSNEG